VHVGREISKRSAVACQSDSSAMQTVLVIKQHSKHV
jgi:hypothetical protein